LGLSPHCTPSPLPARRRATAVGQEPNAARYGRRRGPCASGVQPPPSTFRADARVACNPVGDRRRWARPDGAPRPPRAATAPAQWGSLQDPRRGPFSSIRRRETCQAGEKPPLKALVRAFLVEFHTLLVCGYVFAFFTLFLDAPGPSLRAPSSDVEQHGVRWSMRKVTREASSSKRVGSQRCWNIKLVELLI